MNDYKYKYSINMEKQKYLLNKEMLKDVFDFVINFSEEEIILDQEKIFDEFNQFQQSIKFNNLKKICLHKKKYLQTESNLLSKTTIYDKLMHVYFLLNDAENMCGIDFSVTEFIKKLSKVIQIIGNLKQVLIKLDKEYLNLLDSLIRKDFN